MSVKLSSGKSVNLNEKVSVKVSKRLLNYLGKHGTMRETYEDVIWRLIGQKEISQEDAKSLPPEYSNKLNQGRKKK